MKREARGHTKMKRLCRKLDIPLYQAMGILECLWHLTAVEAWRGDIGKLSNEDIALGMDYRGDEDTLIGALVDTGWLEEDGAYRLVVHDWQEHADDAVKKRVQRAINLGQKGFCREMSRHVQTIDGNVAPPAGHVPTNGQNGSLPDPEPDPEPEPEPEPDPDKNLSGKGKSAKPSSIAWQSELDTVIGCVASNMHGRHPPGRRDIGIKAISVLLVTILRNKSLYCASKLEEAKAYVTKVDSRHEGMTLSSQWVKDGGEYAKALSNWLAPTKDRYEQDAPPAGAIRPRDGPNKKEQATLEFRQRMMDEMTGKVTELNA